MGKVRQDNIKKIARELLRRYPEKFTADFGTNKKIVKSLTVDGSPKIKNKIAGYVTSLRKTMIGEEEEVEEVEEQEKEVAVA